VRPSEPLDDALLASVLAGAGLDRTDLTPELAQNLGQILHVVVSGVMDVLAARQRTKEEFRVGVTKFQRSGRGNNPLKFSTSVEDALHNLLVKRGDGYLGPVEAFEDAFDDLRHHQVAMLHGVRRAFSSMLSRFDPERLQGEFEGQQKGALVAMPAGLRYWNLYRDWFRGMVGDVDASFRDLFGDEFAEAYEEQLRRLKAQGRTGASHRDEDGR
jgi:type VI secretion system FHA domain protein